MKTIALTLFAALLAFAQNDPKQNEPKKPNEPRMMAPVIAPQPKATPKTTAKSAPKPAAPASKPSVQTKKPASAQPLADQKAKAQMPTIPAGAKQVGPNLYRYTDPNGKTWNYRQTPFGISKWADTPDAAPSPQASKTKSEPVLVTDLGDSYRFEKKTPFGASTWVRKKSELTDQEKAIAEGQQAQSNPNQASADSKAAGNR